MDRNRERESLSDWNGTVKDVVFNEELIFLYLKFIRGGVPCRLFHGQGEKSH